MSNLFKNSKAVGNAIFTGAVAVLLIAIVALGFIMSNKIDTLQTEKNTLQASYDQLDSSYAQLYSQYQQLITSPIAGSTPIAKEIMIIQAVAASTNNCTVTAQTTGSYTIIVANVILKDSVGNVAETIPLNGTAGWAVTHTWTDIPVDPQTSLISNNTYTLTLVTKGWGSFVSPSFIIP